MSNLIPIQRPDKNGKVVTRHVKNGVAPASVKAMPAPSIAGAKVASPKKEAARKKPLAKQLKVNTSMGSRKDMNPDPEIYEVLGLDPSALPDLLWVQASDVEIYDMCSVLGTDNAVTFIDRSIKDPEQAKEILESNGLGHLIIDRRELMDQAVDRRIDAWHFLEAQRKFGVDEKTCDPQLILDAARLDSSIALPRWKTNGEDDSYAHRVVRGEISYDDVMTIGMGTLAKNVTLAPHLCSYLKDIHSGNASYDAEVLRHIVDRGFYSADMLASAVSLAGEYGSELLMETHNIRRAVEMDGYRERSTSQRAEMIRYGEQGGVRFASLDVEDIVRFYDAGVPADDAADLLKEGLTVQEAIGVYQDGISKSLSSGFL